MTRVFLALGANLGDREASLRAALRRLGRGCRVQAVSSLYESPAVVLPGQAPGPDYLNAVCEAETELSAPELLKLAKDIERELGRAPGERWGPRPIDIDILLYGDAAVDTPELTVPHPRMAERAFVLAPLAELAPDARHPLAQRTIGEMAEDVDLDGLRHVAGPEWAEEAAR